jgi:hypothetical protein
MRDAKHEARKATHAMPCCAQSAMHASSMQSVTVRSSRHCSCESAATRRCATTLASAQALAHRTAPHAHVRVARVMHDANAPKARA